MLDCAATFTETKSVVALYVRVPYRTILLHGTFADWMDRAFSRRCPKVCCKRKRQREKMRTGLAKRPVMLRILSKMPAANRRFGPCFLQTLKSVSPLAWFRHTSSMIKKKEKQRRNKLLDVYAMNSRYNGKFMRDSFYIKIWNIIL